MNMSRQEISKKIHAIFRDPETRSRLNHTLATAREKLTTSIGDVADLAGITPAQARYAETIKILNPNRRNQANIRAHRRYSLNELNRLIITAELLRHNFSMSDIKEFLTHETSTIQELIEESSQLDLPTRLRQAEEAYLQRMLTPRLLYFAQCLLLGDIFSGAYALFLPMATRPSTLPRITSVTDLPTLGPSLVGWHSRSRPYCVLYMNEPTTDNPSRYEIRSVDELCGLTPEAASKDELTGAYLIIEKEFVQILDQQSTRPSRIEKDAGEIPANPNMVARRILRFFQQDHVSEHHFFGQDYSGAYDGMIYSSPEFMSHLTGDTLLTKVAELIVRLGAVNVRTARQFWTFCNILLPEETTMELPVAQQSLVVVAQSKNSPHRIGITRLAPGTQEGIALRAANSGHAIIRRNIRENDTTIAYNDVESSPGAIGNAMAMPVLDGDARPLAVIYVRANIPSDVAVTRPAAVSTPLGGTTMVKNAKTKTEPAAAITGSAPEEVFDINDQLLLRMLGHMVGDFVASYRARYLTRESLRLMIEWPRMIDSFFRDFKSVNAFRSDMDDALSKAKAALAPQSANQPVAEDIAEGELGRSDEDEVVSIPLTLIAVDINQHSRYVNENGNNSARHLVREVGRRITEQLRMPNRELSAAQQKGSARLYHIDGDRYYVLLRAASSIQARTYAESIFKVLNKPYQLQIRRMSGNQEITVGKLSLDVKVRLAVTIYDRDDLDLLLRPVKGADDIVSALMRTLNQGLYAGTQIVSDNTSVIMLLNNQTGTFEDVAPKDSVLPEGQPETANGYGSGGGFSLTATTEAVSSAALRRA